MDRDDALMHVQQIREQLARAEAFRVYRVASVAFTGAIAFVAAWVQSRWGLGAPDTFVLLWVVVAAISMAVVSVEMIVRCRTTDSVLLRDATIVAARQFVPCVVAGSLLTLAICRFSRESMHLLPGLWSIVFSLGVFASRPGLPRAINFAAAYYLMAGLLLIATAQHQPEFDTWSMPLSFGVGQLLTAAILYVSTSKTNDPT